MNFLFVQEGSSYHIAAMDNSSIRYSLGFLVLKTGDLEFSLLKNGVVNSRYLYCNI